MLEVEHRNGSSILKSGKKNFIDSISETKPWSLQCKYEVTGHLPFSFVMVVASSPERTTSSAISSLAGVYYSAIIGDILCGIANGSNLMITLSASVIVYKWRQQNGDNRKSLWMRWRCSLLMGNPRSLISRTAKEVKPSCRRVARQILPSQLWSIHA